MKKKRTQKQDQESGSANWLCTFNDLTTNLMVFFLLLFSMSSLDLDKSSGLADSLQSGLGVLEAGKKTTVAVVRKNPALEEMENDQTSLRENYTPIYPDTGESAMDRSSMTQSGSTAEKERDESKVKTAIHGVSGQNIEDLNVIEGVSTAFTSHGIMITLDDHLLFNSGQAEINASGHEILDLISRSIREKTCRIRVEGHTDDIPINTWRYPSNWELSIDRAIHVVKYLIHSGKISPQRLSAVGYADVKPLFTNDSEKGRAGNRRVEITLLNGGSTSDER